MSKYRGFIVTKIGEEVYPHGENIKGFWLYTDIVQLDAPCGEVYYASLFEKSIYGIPHYVQVPIRYFEVYDDGAWRKLTRKEIRHIKKELKDKVYY